MNELSSLKNIGNTSAFWLQTVGINTYDQLKDIGAVEAYLRIQDRGIKTSVVLLYALQGALMDIHWNELEPALKDQLRKEADSLAETRNVS